MSDWPGRLRGDYTAINFATFDGAPLANCGMAFLRGVKVALAELSVKSRPKHNKSVAGTVVSWSRNELVVAGKDQFFIFAKYAIEKRIDQWLFQNDLEGFLAEYEELFLEREMIFTAERYPNMTAITNRFAVIFGGKSRSAQLSTGKSDAAVIWDAVPHYSQNRTWLDSLYQRVDLAQGKKVLDIGCGGAWQSLGAWRYGLEAWGCDLYEKEFFEASSHWFNYFQADITDFPVPPTKFDFVFCRDLTPVAYAQHFQYPEMVQFRDRLLQSLNSDGAVFFVLMTNNTGVRKTENDWGNRTTEDLHEWLGKHFKYVEYSRTTYVSILASNRPFFKPWQSVKLPGGTDFRKIWEETRNRLDDITYKLLIQRVSQKFWKTTHLKGGPVFVVGEGVDSLNLATYIRERQTTFELIGVGALPLDLPKETFVYAFDDLCPAQLQEFEEFRHTIVTREELVKRILCNDLYTVGRDHDLSRIRGIRLPRSKEQNPNLLQLMTDIASSTGNRIDSDRCIRLAIESAAKESTVEHLAREMLQIPFSSTVCTNVFNRACKHLKGANELPALKVAVIDLLSCAPDTPMKSIFNKWVDDT